MDNDNMENQFTYKEVIDLGFVREDLGDSVFFDQNGYDWFVVTMKLDKGIQLEWDCETHTVTLNRYNKKYDRLGKIDVPNLFTLKSIINFYTDKKHTCYA
jgi:hypothetical protein